jgi:hypothetical protein
MIKLQASNNLNRLQDQIGNFHNNLQEAISRALSGCVDHVRSELTNTFGGAIDYAHFSINFDGSNFSLSITDLNEFVLMNESGTTAQDVQDQALLMISEYISEALAKENLLGASL